MGDWQGTYQGSDNIVILHGQSSGTDEYYYYQWDGEKYNKTGSSYNEIVDSSWTLKDINDMEISSTTATVYDDTPVRERTDIGEPSITEENWMGKSLEQQARYILDTKYQGNIPDLNLGDYPEDPNNPESNDLEYLMEKLRVQPLKGEIDPTKARFFSEEYGGAGTSFADSLAGRTAGQTLSTSLTSLQGATSKVTGAMQGVYGGSGIGMRAGIAGQGAIKKGFGEAQDAYGLAADTADLGYRKGMYGLEEDVIGDWESNWKSFWDNLPDAT